MPDPLTIIGEKLAEKLIDGAVAAVSWVASEVSKIRNVDKELEDLNNTRTRIEASLSDAVQRRNVRELKSIALDIEDLYDEFHTQANISKDRTRKRKRDAAFTSNRRFADRIDEIRKRYESVCSARGELLIMDEEASRKSVAVAGTHLLSQESCLQVAQFYGRDAEIEQIVEFLLSGNDDGLPPVLSIIGCGGLGKTTLARRVYDDPRVEKHFKEMRIWVGLEKGFDLVRTTEEIVKSIEKKECRLSSLNLLQYRLKKLLEKKKFLLVLDNVWNEDLSFWERLCAPLNGSAAGSKILITTRSKKVSRNAHRSWRLESLRDKESLDLLLARAFPPDQPDEIRKNSPDLVAIGDQIVKKCQGLPLAVKSVAGILYRETDEHKWRRVVNEMSEHEAVEESVTPTLKVSYDHLPLDLKHCFAFCSIFPNGYEFGKNELIKLWMALGFIKPKRITPVENVGDDYFNGLMWRSFFHVSDSCGKDNLKYKMPSMIHDLARSVSEFECLRADANEVQQDDVKMARYALLKDVDLGKVFGNKCLRALMLYGGGGMLSKQVLSKLFSEMRYLRVLDLSCSMMDAVPDSVGDSILLRYLNLSSTRIAMLPESVGNLYNLQTLELGNCSRLTKLPDSVGDLKHLRYLGLRGTKIERLPESVSNLENLQTLELGECCQLLELPKGLSNLVSLKHLGLHLDWEVWDMKTDLVSMPVGIGKLTSLQTLSRFVVGSQRGCGIEELRNLTLRGELCISKLELVSPDEAERAKLEDKRRIDTMMLRWNGGAGSNSQNGRNDEEVLEHLRPHVNLKQLWIDNYKGDRFPEWMGEPSYKTLECLRLSNCTQCQALPSVGELPQLRILRIEGLQGVESMDHVVSGSENAIGFPCLESLSLMNMPHLQKFEVIGGDMAKLSELTISNCSDLRQLPYLPPSVLKLEIRDCPQLTSFPELPSLQDLVIVGGSNVTFGWIEKCSSLSSLTISKFPSLECIPKGLTSLTKLLIQECDQLVSLDQNERLQSLSSLEHLEISSCPSFSFFSDEKLPANLKELRLVNCKNITSWPEEMKGLSSLHIMEIQDLPGLRSLPMLPINLKYLTISGCPTLQNWCHKEGAAWLTEQGIAFLKIDPVEPTSWFQKIAAAFIPRTQLQ